MIHEYKNVTWYWEIKCLTWNVCTEETYPLAILYKCVTYIFLNLCTYIKNTLRVKMISV